MSFKTDIYADGADLNGILAAAENPLVKGFTTNPSLMRQAGITNYETFAKTIMRELKQRRPDTNISLEVFADDPVNMIRQARAIHAWSQEIGYPVYIKIPITNTQGESTAQVIRILTYAGIPCNITAVFTAQQVREVLPAIAPGVPTIISVFCGRIADAGQDPMTILRDCQMETVHPDYAEHEIKFLWASPREVFNYVQSCEMGCHIITMTPQLIQKLSLIGKDLTEYSLDTVKMFYNDALASGYTIEG
jgi:transaldolase